MFTVQGVPFSCICATILATMLYLYLQTLFEKYLVSGDKVQEEKLELYKKYVYTNNYPCTTATIRC